MALTLNNQEHIFDMYKEDKLEKPNYLIKVCVWGEGLIYGECLLCARHFYILCLI